MSKRRYTDDQFSEAVRDSFSIRGVLIKLNLVPTGGNYILAKRRIKELELDSSHFMGQGYLKGKNHNWGVATPLEEILVENSTYHGGTFGIKNKLFKEGILERKCYRCGITEWQDEPAPLELEHINGERTDNRIENLTILCANCHALTPTHAGKNIRNKNNIVKEKINKDIVNIEKNKSIKTKDRYTNYCELCSKEFYSEKNNRKYCSYECSRIANRKVDRPSKEELEELIKTNSWSALGRKFGVSDNAVKKWAKQYYIIE